MGLLTVGNYHLVNLKARVSNLRKSANMYNYKIIVPTPLVFQCKKHLRRLLRIIR